MKTTGNDKQDLVPNPCADDRQDLLQRISALTQANQSLKRELQDMRQRHLEQLNSLNDGLYTLDVEGNLTFVNRAIEKIAGLPAEELLGRHYRRWLDSEIFAEIEVGRQRVLEESGTVRFEVEILNERGERYCLEFNSGPIRQGDRIVGTQGILRDVTARKQAERHDHENKKLLDSLFHAISESVMLVAPDGRIKAVNQTGAVRFGQQPEVMVNRNVKEFFGSEVFEARWAKGHEVLNSGKPLRFVDEREGHAYDVSMYPATDPDTHEQRLVVFARDITKQKQAEKALVESEYRYRTLVEGACEGIAMHDFQGVIRFLNRQAAINFGGEVSDFVGKSLRDVIDEPYASQHLAFIREVIESGKSQSAEKFFIDSRGQSIWLNLTVIPLQDTEKKIRNAMVIAQDITPLKKAQEELKLFRDKMARAERLASAGTLSAMVAHEFAQPLTVMRLSVQNALASLANGQPDWLREDLQDCLKEISNVSVILERFRSFAKVALERKSEAVHLDALLHKTVTLFQDNAKALAITLNEESLQGLAAVWACEKDLEQLFFILIENSLQALQGKQHGTLHIRAASSDHHICVQLQDTCGGIAPEHMGRIFDPFFTTKVHQQGTGLGLCIVKRILEEAGGDIVVDNRLGEGVTFTVTLPVTSE